MAIQIWDAQAGQYKSADLARFGGSGTLSEALVWDGTQYVKVWPPAPTGPTPLWTDDFTSPAPHPRWSLFGPYNPPGLDTGAVGPQVSDDFEVIIEADPAGAPGVGALTSDFSAGVVTAWVNGQLVLTSLGAAVTIDGPSPHPPNATSIGIRRQAGVWHLLVDGVSVGSAPDPFAANALNITVEGIPGYPVTFVSYTQFSETTTVTPQAPTFLTASPWYTLPTQAGVTYTVSGTPGYNQSVTITATPQAGYALAGQTSWAHTYGPEPLPVVTITGTSGNASRDQFRAACIAYGTTYQTVQELPFLLDTSQATNMTNMFYGCSSLTQVPDLDTGNVTTMAYMFYGCSSLTQVPDLETGNVTTMNSMFDGCSSLAQVPDLDTANVTTMRYMFYGCSSLTDGNVRLIGKHPSVSTSSMIAGSGLTRRPFYDANGNPI